MKKLSIRISAMLMAVALLVSNSNLMLFVSASTSLANGLHEVEVSFVNATSDAESHANGALTGTADLYVSGNQIYLEFETQTISMGTISANLKGLEVEGTDAEILSTDDAGQPNKFRVKLDTIQEYYTVSLNVEMPISIPGVDHSAMAARLKVTIPENSLKDSTVTTPDGIEEESALANGLHEVSLNLWHITNDAASHADGVLTGSADLYVNNKSYILEFDTKVLNMSNVTAYLKGITVAGQEAKVVSYGEDGNPDRFQVKLNSIEEFYEASANVEMSIQIPGVDHSAMSVRLKLTIGEDSLKDSTVTAPPINEEDNNNGTDTDDSTNNGSGSEDEGNNGSGSTTVTELDFTTMEAGTYEIAVDLWHASNNTASMASAAITKTARIVVENQKATVYIYTKPMTLGTITASLIDFTYDQNGTMKDAIVVTAGSDGNPTTFSLILTRLEQYLNVTVNPHIAMMGNQPVDARLKFDLTTLKKIAEDTNVSETPDSSDNNGTTNNGTTNNGSANNGTTNNGTTNNGSTNSGTTNNGSANSGTTNNGSANNGTTNNGTTNNGTTNNGSTNNSSSNNGTANSGSTSSSTSGSNSTNGNTSGSSSVAVSTGTSGSTISTEATETEETEEEDVEEEEQTEDEQEETAEEETAEEETAEEETAEEETVAEEAEQQEESQKTSSSKSSKTIVVKRLKIISLALGGGSAAAVGSYALYLRLLKGRVK